MLLQEIIKGESKKIELKEELPDSKKYIKTIVAFANTAGGKLIVGIEDRTKEVLGIPEDSIFNVKDKIADTITNMCSPQIIPNIYIVPIEDKNIIVVEVFPGANRPYYIKSDGKDNGTYVRVSGSSRLADSTIIRDLEFQGSRLSFDEMICSEYKVTDEKIKKLCTDLQKYIKREIKIIDLVNMKLIKESSNGYLATNTFTLLTGNHYEYAYIQCARFKGKTRSVFIDRKEYEGPLYEQIEGAFAFVKNHINLSSEINELQRKDKYEIPIGAIREMIINAVVHRNYILNNSSIQLAIYDDRIEVTSPGMLVGQLDIMMIKEGRSEVRNKTIARVFKNMDLIERWGTGVTRIIEECKEYRLKEPKFEELGNSFRVTIYRNEPINEPINEHEKAVIDLIKIKATITYVEIEEQLDISISTVKKIGRASCRERV